MEHKHHTKDGDHKRSEVEKKNKRNFWMYIGVGVLIVLLIVWLTIASLWEDTDVAAFIPLLRF